MDIVNFGSRLARERASEVLVDAWNDKERFLTEGSPEQWAKSIGCFAALALQEQQQYEALETFKNDSVVEAHEEKQEQDNVQKNKAVEKKNGKSFHTINKSDHEEIEPIPHAIENKAISETETNCEFVDSKGVQTNIISSEVSPTTLDSEEELAERKKPGRKRRFHSAVERVKAFREKKKMSLNLPPLPEGAYRSREVSKSRACFRDRTLKREILAAEQENKCFYCERFFASWVQWRDSEPIQLSKQLEHFLPRKIKGSRRDDNFHACCHLCNMFKSDIVFSSIKQCRMWLKEAWDKATISEVDVKKIRWVSSSDSVIWESIF